MHPYDKATARRVWSALEGYSSERHIVWNIPIVPGRIAQDLGIPEIDVLYAILWFQAKGFVETCMPDRTCVYDRMWKVNPWPE